MKYSSVFLTAALLLVCTSGSRSQELVFSSFSGFAASEPVANSTTIIEHMIGEPFYGKPSQGDIVIHSGIFPACLIPVATVGVDVSGALRPVDINLTDYSKRFSPVPVGSLDSICPGESILLRVIGGRTYQWSTGATSDTITVTPLNDTTLWARAFIPGARSNVDSCYASRADTIVLAVRRLYAELELGSLPMVNPANNSGAVGAKIPITLVSQWSLDQCPPDSIYARIRVNRTLFKPRRVDAVGGGSGRIVDDKINGADRIFTIMLPTPTTLANNSIIGYLVGDVLLGNADATPIEFIPDGAQAPANWYKKGQPHPVVTTYRNGSITLDPLCRAGGTRLLDWDAPGLPKITPNPARDEVTITMDLPDGIMANLELYAVNGTRVYSSLITPQGQSIGIGRTTQTLTIPTATLANGKYQVVVRAGTRQSSSSLIIEH